MTNLHKFYALDVTKTSVVGLMEHSGYKAALMRAPRLTGTGKHGLPPGVNCPIWPVDALPGAPEDWLRGPGNYVCPVEPGWGLWFSWTMNDQLNTAVLPSVKGMNPVTGDKLEGFSLEQYVEKCPRHKEPFKTDLLCEKCGYRWPAQSYISHPNTLWWDGFRQADGSVRQFFFSEDDERDIASLVIGKKNTVPAFGFAFYETLKRREVERVRSRGPGGQSVSVQSFNGTVPCSADHSAMMDYLDSMPGSLQSKGIGPDYAEMDMMVKPETTYNLNSVGPHMGSTTCHVEPEQKTSGGILKSMDLSQPRSKGRGLKGPGGGVLRSAGGSLQGTQPNPNVRGFMEEREDLPVKAVAVGAGAEIAQELATDPLGVAGWKDKPAAVIRLYFVFEKQFRQIVKAGVKDLAGDKSGYLKNLPVG